MSDDSSGRSLLRLPPEIILSVADSLDISDLNSLLRSSRHLANLLQSQFYRLAAKFTFVSRGQRSSPLFWAAEHGRLATVRKLVDAGADVTKLHNGISAFHHAVQKGHADIARVLLDAGADPAQPTRNGDVPLIKAAEHGLEDMVVLLLGSTNTKTATGQSDYARALARAVYFGHLRLVRMMLDQAAIARDESATIISGWLDLRRDEDLMYNAARAGNCEMIRLLLDYGAKVPPVHRKSTHPLVVAAQNGHKDAVSVLISASADPTYEDKKVEAAYQSSARGPDMAQSPSHSVTGAAGNGSAGHSGDNLTRHLVQKYGNDLTQPTKDGRTPLQIALEEFSLPAVIDLMLDRGADPNVRGRGGSTPLHTLVRLKRHDLLETLLSAGGSLEIPDDKCYTPLLLAVAVSNTTAASLFIQCGADVLAKEHQGRTPLHIAASQGSAEIVAMLLNEDADVTLRDDDGRIPLHHATLSGNVSIFKAILSRHNKTKSNYLVTSHTGRTVLEMVAEGGHLPLLDVLIQNGVDMKDHPIGYSALHAAVANNHPEMVEFLLSHGANPVFPDYYGRTPFDLAIKNPAMLDRLLKYCDTTRTSPAKRLAALEESVVVFTRRILNGETSDIFKLAKCLVYLNDRDAALPVFRQAAKLMVNTDDLRYHMSCNGCRKRLRGSGRTDFLVLVCRRCHDLDSCDFADRSPFLGFYSTDAGFAVDTSRSTDNDEAASSWKELLEWLIAKYS